MKASVIGLGIIGLEWAKHLDKDGLLAASWNRTKKNDAPEFTENLSSIPEISDIIHIVVSDPQAVSETLDKILPALSSKQLVIQSSTIDPESAKIFSYKVLNTGASYLESPFTGSLPAAQKRELVFYTGGDIDVLNRARPYLEKLSKSILHIGNVEQACVLKLVMNLQITSAFEALAEALSTSRKAGISDQIFFEAFKCNASYTAVAAMKESKLLENDFSPQFSIKHMAKDMRLLKKSVGDIILPVHEKVLELLELAEKSGYSEDDFSSLIKLR